MVGCKADLIGLLDERNLGERKQGRGAAARGDRRDKTLLRSFSIGEQSHEKRLPYVGHKTAASRPFMTGHDFVAQ